MDDISDTIMCQNGRRSGYTFRTLLKALLAVSEGHKAIISCSNHRMAQWTFGKAMDLCAAYMAPPEYNRQRLTIKMPGGGVLYFLTRTNPHAAIGLGVHESRIFLEV